MLKHILSVGVCAVLFSSSAFAYGPKNTDAVPITDFYLTNIQNNETIEVKYGSQGCFHSNTADIIFESSRVTVGKLGARELSFKEQKRIENYFAYVDGLDGDMGCTTMTTMTLTRKQNGKAVSAKTLIDGSCGFGVKKKEDYLSLGQLYYGLKEAQPKMSKWTNETK